MTVKRPPVVGLAKMRAAVHKRLEALGRLVDATEDETLITDVHCNLDRDVQAHFCSCVLHLLDDDRALLHKDGCLYMRLADKSFDLDGWPHSYYGDKTLQTHDPKPKTRKIR